MKATENFFSKKRPWSLLKDEILRCYLVPYVSKILRTGNRVIIADCFAGKGQFDDGRPGSPIIIASIIENILKQNPGADIEGVFIEKKYFKNLEKNLKGYECCKLLDGSFEERLENFLAKVHNTRKNIFLYVDPYGIKNLDLQNFKRIAEKKFSSFELLMNFNSFGFLREGCRLLELRKFEIYDDSEEYELESGNTVSRMNAIASGTYWQDILTKYNAGQLTMQDTEKHFVEEYDKRLRTVFKYVVNIPVKKKRNNLPKYRLFFGTNHPDGLLLMADKMSRTWHDFVVEDRNGLTILYEELDYPDMVGWHQYDIREDILQLTATKTLLKDLLVALVEKYGITFPVSRLKEEIKDMEKGDLLSVERDPARTPGGKPTNSMDYKKYTIRIERIN